MILPLLLIAMRQMRRATAGRRASRPVRRRDWSRSAAGVAALDILKERYAGGGISREEYRRMRRELKV
jgi:uncharacterized membrane protein